jgi:hypothetical protein
MNSLPNPIGRKVVCVEDHFHPNVLTHYRRIPVKDGVYTITEVKWSPHYETGQLCLGFRFTELLCLPPFIANFAAYHFRFLEDEKIVRSQRRKQLLPRTPREPAPCSKLRISRAGTIGARSETRE